MHPAFVARQNRKYFGVLYHDLKRAVALTTGWRPKWNEDKKYVLRPTPDAVEAWVDRCIRLNRFFECDIETDGKPPQICNIRCIGLYDGEHAICVPLLFRDGTYTESTPPGAKKPKKIFNWLEFYDGAAKYRVLVALQKLFAWADVAWKTALEEIRAGGQNFQFDRLCLRSRLGLKIGRRYFDTLLAHHIVASMHPHNLAFIASLNTDVSYYKSTEEGEAWSTQNDEELWIYCLRGSTSVVLADGSRRRIDELVRDRFHGNVLSLNEMTGRIEEKPVIGWHRNVVPDQKWISIETLSGRSIVTPDHEIFVRGRWIRADTVKIGDELASDEPLLSNDQRNAILGTCLGDSSLVVSPTWRRRRLDAPSVGVQGLHRKDSQLAQKKVDALGPIAALGYEVSARRVSINGRTGKGRRGLAWRVKNLRQLRTYIGELFGTDGHRRLNVGLLKEIGPVGWAWWFMDDGCRQNGQKRPAANNGKRGGRTRSWDTVAISTQRYPRRDLDEVVEWFRTEFGATTCGADGVLRLGPVATNSFCTRIAPYVFETQRYKFPRDRPFEWPKFEGIKSSPAVPLPTIVTHVEEFVPTDRRNARWCIDVKDNHNFFTPAGLVHNCCRDTVAQWESARKLIPNLRNRAEDVELYDFDLRLTNECEAWKETGLLIDPIALQLYRDYYTAKADRALGMLKACVRALTGGDLSASNEDAVAELARLIDDSDSADFKPGSLPQLRNACAALGIPLTHETDTGQLSTAKEWLLEARAAMLERKVDARDPRIAFLDYLFAWREASKIESTYLRPEILPDGRVHPTFHVGPPTGRLASSDPNAQNWPAEIRGMVVAEKDHSIVYIDWDAGELRLAGLVSNEMVLIAAFALYDAGKGPKIHKVNGSIIFNVPMERLTEPLYRAAKVFAYAVMYGATEMTVYEQVRKEMPDMLFSAFQVCFKNFKKGLATLFKWQEQLVAQGSKNHFLDSPILKRRSYFFERGWNMENPEASKMLNLPEQSGLADIVGLANFRIIDELFPKYVRMLKPGEVFRQLVQVHDELAFEVPDRLVDQFKKELKAVAERPTKQQPKWHMPVEAKAAKRWKPIPLEVFLAASNIHPDLFPDAAKVAKEKIDVLKEDIPKASGDKKKRLQKELDTVYALYRRVSIHAVQPKRGKNVVEEKVSKARRPAKGTVAKGK